MYVHPGEHYNLADKSRYAPFFVHETVLEQGSGDDIEDVLSVANDLYIVCDGATSISRVPSHPAVSGGRQAAELTAAAFSGNNGSLQYMVRQANNEIFQAMAESAVVMEDRESLWSTSFAALRFSCDYIEWAQSGDCLIVLVFEDGSHELITEPPGQDIVTLQKWKEIGRNEKKTIYQVLAEEIGEVRRRMNRDYGVLNGEAESLDFVRYGVEDVSAVTDILLFSDGLSLPRELPEEAVDISRMVELYRHQGLDGIKRQVRRMEQQDPR
ncbi:MAG: protein phosphatase 2C domain-containing protein, partial [Desulfocapsaceae bacterium]|nr:protein phosphatase 2C domain-containing protein [Desulfocapsaceae bacterium]